ncbi:Regulator protein [Candidatus Competibacter denitrificans Run_A_D11]|uniref:Regulator protein n=1 Tax=Candidatus Competibacter denitrificans Run_A_D11 TaxID=1400863 RepID=W6M763_9GAMM|nr:tRNA (N6-threonylcarbamoyladenosine(37)-N6)-methyltransferase TrmO [Candidatus Competibacter denitrificans]CDI02459.1 Regulator protein [Candidatus Competibacter denitrificans Run_A_D11]HAS85811.1 tRNA (N6-threonylcarbamoyladenosine(37)-N6)-methyltransferase TrmO [Candidatus Competibacteraceae bacterium]HRC69760.1 tRNA (N6-threonylcarbamoyladenosine(37)-N6)-methyltransferase TrmO [Candidatus Competibacter denitrificans]
MLAFTPVGIIHSCFREKFGIPRQPGLVPAARATLELLPPYNQPETVRGLEGFSHVWLVFVFHGIPAGHWQPTVRPPRLGGNRRLGLFATRTPFRPNPIGLSVVRLERVAINRGRVTLHLTGIDLLDETPVLDIKPYLPYVDCIPTATGGFATELPATGITVEFSPEAATVCAAWPSVNLRELITQLLAQDPRPAYERADPDSRCYGMKLFDFDVRWEMRDGLVYVMEIVPIEKAGSVPTPADESPHPADRPGWPPSAGQ